MLATVLSNPLKRALLSSFVFHINLFISPNCLIFTLGGHSYINKALIKATSELFGSLYTPSSRSRVIFLVSDGRQTGKVNLKALTRYALWNICYLLHLLSSFSPKQAALTLLGVYRVVEEFDSLFKNLIFGVIVNTVKLKYLYELKISESGRCIL